jgi:hypothetical protein
MVVKTGEDKEQDKRQTKIKYNEIGDKDKRARQNKARGDKRQDKLRLIAA